MAHARRDELPLVGIVALHQKLRHRIAHRGALDMFAECPPTVVPHLLEIAIGTIEQGHVLRHPLPCFRIRNGLHDVLILHRIEVFDIMLIVIVFQKSGSSIRISSLRLYIGNSEAGFRLALTSLIECAIPIGRGIDIRESTFRTCTEHDALDGFHRSKEHALTSLLAIHEDLCHSLRNTQNGLDVIGGVGFVFAQSTITGTTLAAHQPFVGEFYT